ncbi:hypothetical protein ES703_115105 [subsurface metagenome]
MPRRLVDHCIAASNDGILVYYHPCRNFWPCDAGEGQLVPTTAGIQCPPDLKTVISQIYTISLVEIGRHHHHIKGQ